MGLFVDYKSAVFAVLNAVPALAGRVHQTLEQADAWPRIWLEDGGAVDWGDKSSHGLSAEIVLHVGSKYAGELEVSTIFDAIHGALHDADLVLAGGQSVVCRYVRHDIMFDNDGVTRHGVIRFGLLISED